MFCATCGLKADWLSMHQLCEKCQKRKGAIKGRQYDIETGGTTTRYRKAAFYSFIMNGGKA